MYWFPLPASTVQMSTGKLNERKRGSMLQYSVELNDFDIKKLHELASEHFSGDFVEKVMTLGERLREEGRRQMQPVIEQAAKEAEKHKAEDIAVKLLLKGDDPKVVSEVTGMPLVEVERLMKRKQ